MAVLCGMGGAGKTSVAVEYAHRQADRVRGGVAVAGGGSGWAGGGLRRAGRASGGLGGLRDAVGRVHAVLARRCDWLLVFDNVPDPAAMAGLVPPTGGGRVVITSQFGSWPGRQVLEVPVLDRAVAAGSCSTGPGRPEPAEEAAAVELPGELGGLPLALEQAGAYLQASSRSVAEYLGLFQARRGELLNRGDPAGYDKRVTTTWALAFAELGGAGPAAGLLRLVACCAAEDIPLDLLLRSGLAAGDFDAVVAPLLVPLLVDDLARDEAMAGLRRFSLISAPRGGLVLMPCWPGEHPGPAPGLGGDVLGRLVAIPVVGRAAGDPETRGPGRCSRRCCRMPRPRWTRPATACTRWPGTSARAAAIPRRWPCSSRSCMPGRKPWAPSTPTR